MSGSAPPLSGKRLASDMVTFAGARAAHLIPQTRISGPIPWVIAIMIALTIMAAGGAMALSNLAARADADLSGAVTVQVIEANAVERSRKAKRAVTLLAEDSAVRSLRRIPQTELNALLEPWLGAGEVDEAVPIPALIDVELHGRADVSEVARLQRQLDARMEGVRVDAQSSWLQPVYSALTSLQYLALTLIGLLAITSAAAVWLAARNAFSTNRETIEIVHHLGGTDAQIARIFQRTVALDAAVGSGLGMILGLAGMYFVGSRFAALDSGMVEGGGLTLNEWLVIGLIPLVGILLAILTARFTIIRALRKML